MGEALEAATKKLGMPGKTTSEKADNGTVDPLATLRATIATIQDATTRDLLQGQADDLLARLELRTKETKRKARLLDEENGSDRDPAAPQAAATNQPVSTKWTVIGGRPVPDEEGEYTFSQALRVAQLETGNQNKNETGVVGLVKALADLGVIGGGGGGPDPVTQKILDRAVDQMLNGNANGHGLDVNAIRGEITTLKEQLRTALDPIESAKRLAEWRKGLEDAGFVSKAANDAESIELVKEKNRHEEQMTVAKAEADSKKSMADTLARLPETVSDGIATVIADRVAGDGAARAGDKTQLEHMTCQNVVDGAACGGDIAYPANATRVVCPKCRMVYNRTPGT